MDNLLIKLLTRSPLWAIAPEAMHQAILRLQNPTADWVAAKPTVHATGKRNNKLAVIPVQGVLTKDGPSWYGSSYDSITSAANQAAADPDVKRVVLSVDSPGGEVVGLPETAAVLNQLAKIKPVSAIVEGTSASAAYWLTSQANDISLTPSGEVGSVGVRMMHADVSKMLDDAGIKITELSSGDFKTEWSPYKPLSDEAVANMQPRLEAVHQDFLNAVINGRAGHATENIKTQRFGEGRMFSANDALGHGMVDKIQSPSDFYQAILPTQEESAVVPSYGFQRARLELERRRFSS